MRCDGHISEDEFHQLMAALFRMKLFSRINEKQFNQVLNKLMGVLKKHGPDSLVDGCCETLPEELRKAAFANAFVGDLGAIRALAATVLSAYGGRHFLHYKRSAPTEWKDFSAQRFD